MMVVAEWVGVSLLIAGMIRGTIGGPAFFRFWGSPGPISKRNYIWLLVWSAVLAVPVVWFVSLVSRG